MARWLTFQTIGVALLLANPASGQEASVSDSQTDLRLASYVQRPVTSGEEPAGGRDLPTPGVRNDRWTFEFAPYFWASSLRSEVDDGDSSATSEACFIDLLSDLDFGAMARFEGRHESRWGFYLEGLYIGLSDDSRARVGPFRLRGLDVDTTITQIELDFGGMYRFGDAPHTFDLLVGGRYTHLGAEIDLGPLSLESNSDFVAPAVGGRVIWDLDEKWLVSVKADAAGFGVGEAPDVTWGVTGILGYRLSARAILGLGYRYYDSSADDGDTDVDLSYHGPMIGLAWQF